MTKLEIKNTFIKKTIFAETKLKHFEKLAQDTNKNNRIKN